MEEYVLAWLGCRVELVHVDTDISTDNRKLVHLDLTNASMG
jgi:hypothetical protein